MAIIDIDDLLKEEEEQGFKINGKTYKIPDFSHDRLLKLGRLRQKIANVEPTDKNAFETLLNLNIEFICAAVPELTADFIKKHFPSKVQQQILQIINVAQIGEAGQTAIEEELAYYRKKMGDTFRKKGNARGGK